MPAKRLLHPPPQLRVDPLALVARLDDPTYLPDPADLATLRDHAAAHLMTDPAYAHDLSQRLMKLVRRHRAAAGAEGLAHALRCRAEACLFTGRLRLARRAYEQASEAAVAAGRDDLLGQILVGRVHLLSLLGEAAAAEALGDQAQRLLRRTQDTAYLGKLQMNRGNAFYQQDRYREALAAYAGAARAFESLGQREATWVGLLMNQGIACTSLARIGEARRLFLRVERECERLGLEALLAQARFNRAFLEALRGDFRTALALLEQAGAAFAAQAQRDMLAASQRSRAEIYLELGLADEAWELTQLAAAEFEREAMALDAVLARLDGVRCLLALGRAAEAAAPLAAAAEFYRKRRLRPRVAQVLLLQAAVAQHLADVAGAQRLAARAVRLYAALELPTGEREARFLLADIALARGRWATAAEVLAPIAAESRRLGVAQRLRLHALLGRIARRQHRLALAGRHLDRAIAALEAQRRLIPSPELRTRVFDRHRRLYGERIDIGLDAGQSQFAPIFRLAERGRARGFRERTVAGAVADGDALREERAALASLTRRLEDAEHHDADPAALARLRREALARERRLLGGLHRRAGLAAGGAEWERLPALSRLRALLAPDECLVQYFVTEERVLAMILGLRRQQLVALPAGIAAIRGSVERFRFQLNAAALVAVQPSADLGFLCAPMLSVLQELHAMLVAPLAIAPPTGRLTFVPHDFLHAIPFECLHDGRAFVDESFEITRIPTADSLLVRERRRRRRRGKDCVAGAVRIGPPEVGAEVAAVAEQFAAAGRPAALLIDPTREALLSELPACRHLHLSTHGRFRADNPYFSRLATDDGAVFLSDIEGLELNAELVVLSACESGAVVGELGDELAGVAHGFLVAGTRHLLASRWRVHDLATREFMIAFYRHHLADAAGNPGRARGLAAREIRTRRPHPFYWGGFSLYGA